MYGRLLFASAACGKGSLLHFLLPSRKHSLILDAGFCLRRCAFRSFSTGD